MNNINSWSKYIVSVLAFLTVFRFLFFILHFPGNNINLNAIIISLLNGVRFDLSALTYLFIPIWGVYIFLSLPSFNQKSFLVLKPLITFYLSLLIILFTIIHIIDIGFFYEFNTRINYLAFEYLSYIKFTLNTIISVFPYNILFISCLLLLLIETVYLKMKLDSIPIIKYNKYSTWFISFICITIMMVIGMRGGLQKIPLNWSHANITPFRFTNQLSLNPLWNLGTTIHTAVKENVSNNFKSIEITLNESDQIARKSVQDPNADFLFDDHPALRKSISPYLINNYNIVVILMESFAGIHVGKLGDTYNITPYFDQLTDDGILFNRMFATGTRTNRGLSGTLLSFPALPRFKTILNDASVDQQFSSLANVLKQRNYATYFLVGGALEYDNRHGFFLGQGYDHFYGRYDYGEDVFSTVWGVADEHLFEKSFNILKNVAEPTLMTILTLTNHPTYDFPASNNIKPLEGKLKNNKRLNAFKYSDFALGEFMKRCKDKGLYKNTIFVILGDHGMTSGSTHQNMSVDIASYYIPCLIIAPELTPGINNRTASQIDIIPTILGLLGGSFIHNSWGKNLFGVNNYVDFATIAPSGLNHIMGIITDELFYIYNFNDRNSNELYSISNSIYPLQLNKLEYNQLIESSLEKNMLGFTKSAYNALTSYNCGIYNAEETQ